jgi:hypothetical protein
MIKEKVDDNKKIVIGLIFLSTLFHYTAAIYAVIFFISSEKQYKPLYFWSIPISYALYFAGVSLISLTPYLGGDGLNELYESYSSKIINYNSFNLIQLCNCLICMFFWYRVDMFSKYSKYFLITLKLFTIGCCIGVLFGNIGVVATRLADMFWSVEIILFPFLMYSAAPHAKCIKLIPVIVAIVLFYFSFNSSHWDNGLLMI